MASISLVASHYSCLHLDMSLLNHLSGHIQARKPEYDLRGVGGLIIRICAERSLALSICPGPPLQKLTEITFKHTKNNGQKC